MTSQMSNFGLLRQLVKVEVENCRLVAKKVSQWHDVDVSLGPNPMQQLGAPALVHDGAIC
jgi:hypothetical protein